MMRLMVGAERLSALETDSVIRKALGFPSYENDTRTKGETTS